MYPTVINSVIKFYLTSKFHDNSVGFIEGGFLKPPPLPLPRPRNKSPGGIGLINLVRVFLKIGINFERDTGCVREVIGSMIGQGDVCEDSSSVIE